VYGPGRDQGVTSDVTVALQHAMRGARFHIRFGGHTALQHASDVARAFIAAALAPKPGAAVYNLRGTVVPMSEVVRAIDAATGTTGLVTFDDNPLPIAANLNEGAFQAAYGPFRYLDLLTGFRQTVDVWKSAA
jgi:UDP-glucuronate 4-epimerase